MNDGLSRQYQIGAEFSERFSTPQNKCGDLFCEAGFQSTPQFDTKALGGRGEHLYH